MEEKEMQLKERTAILVSHVANQVIAHVAAVADIELDDIVAGSNLLTLVDHDKDKALLILLMLEKKFDMDIPDDKQAFIEHYQNLDDLVDFFVFAHLKREGLVE